MKKLINTLLIMALCAWGFEIYGYTHLFENKTQYDVKVRVDYWDPECGCSRTERFKMRMRESYPLEQKSACPLYRIEALIDDSRQEFVVPAYLDEPFIGDSI